MTNREAIEELKELIEIDLHPCPPIYEEALNLAIKALEARPAGEWTTVKGIEGTYYCSECDGDIDWKSNYCPWCGADMRGGTND